MHIELWSWELFIRLIFSVCSSTSSWGKLSVFCHERRKIELYLYLTLNGNSFNFHHSFITEKRNPVQIVMLVQFQSANVGDENCTSPSTLSFSLPLSLYLMGPASICSIDPCISNSRFRKWTRCHQRPQPGWQIEQDTHSTHTQTRSATSLLFSFHCCCSLPYIQQQPNRGVDDPT